MAICSLYRDTNPKILGLIITDIIYFILRYRKSIGSIALLQGVLPIFVFEIHIVVIGHGINSDHHISLIPLENIPCIDLVFYIIQAGIIAVGYNGI